MAQPKNENINDREKYKFRESINNEDETAVAVQIESDSSNEVKVKGNNTDFRLMLSYQEKILRELKIMNMYLAEFAGDKIEDAE